MNRVSIKRCAAVLIAAALLRPQDPLGAAWAAGQATLDGIEVQPDQVIVYLSEPVEHEIFTIAEPPRLVIELLGTEYAAPAKALRGGGKYIRQVRSGQYQREPDLISRIVLDLTESVAYDVKWKANRLFVMINRGAEDDVEDAEAEAAEEAKAALEEQPISAAPAKPVQVARAPLPPPSMRDAAAAARPAAAPPVYFPKGTDSSRELAAIAAASDAGNAKAPPEKKRARRKRKKKKASRRERRDIMATLPTEPITIDFDTMDMGDVLRLMAAKAKINIVFGADVAGQVTLRLVDVPFNEAFITILSMNGLVTNQIGERILRVMTPATLTTERAAAVTQTRVIRLKYVKADKAKAVIDTVRVAEGRGGNIAIDDNTNSLLVTDSLDGIARVERLLSKIDVRPQQVMIEAKIVEVNLTKDFSFGIQWDYFQTDTGRFLGKEGFTDIGNAPNNPAPIPPSTFIDGSNLRNNLFPIPSPSVGAQGRGTGVNLPASAVFGALTLGRVTNNYILSATLSAAASKGKVKVLSDPKITTINGQAASIDITTSIPFVTSVISQGATPTITETVSYTVTGIKLSVTPTINADGHITLEIAPTISQPSATAAAAGSTGAIATDSRTAKTTVIVKDGGTIVIGGLITDSVSDTIAKVPLLGDIPIIGWLFKKKTVSRTRVELLIFVTTKIIDV
ncbi:MAG: type IV pilus secretin PilQ [Elusimicrobiota bacterium]